MRAALWVWIATLGLLLAGCPTGGGDDDGTDDDGADDDGGDDDGGDDDTFPASPSGYRIEVALSATGGANGGAANVQYDHIMIDANYNDLCTIGFDFTATYDFGQNQGNDFWQSIDEVITWTSGGETSNNCPIKWVIYKGDPISWFMWSAHPMAFVSCSQVQTVPALANTQLGIDMVKNQFGDTFGAWCNDLGPAMELALGSGPVEGIWLLPGIDGALDLLGAFGYFAPPSQANVDVWMLLGLLMADATNSNEPTAGLQGDYVTLPVWLWLYSP